MKKSHWSSTIAYLNVITEIVDIITNTPYSFVLCFVFFFCRLLMLVCIEHLTFPSYEVYFAILMLISDRS